jgi:phosphoglycerate dehydrogenase-like enzyme
MSKLILVTDSLFIFPEHEEILQKHGYQIERLNKPNATEEELIQALKGKVGYILGGIEKITERVIESTDELKAIAFTGSDWVNFIPGFNLATQKGIKISNTPGANTYAVAEYTITMMLAMSRNIFELGRTGKTSFQTRVSLKDLTIGIIGMGHIGSKVASMLKGLEAGKIIYNSRQQKSEIEKQTGATFVDLETLLKTSDIVSLHFSKEAGAGFIDTEKLALMKDGALIVNCGFTGAIDNEALFKELKSGRIRAVQDDPVNQDFNELPLSVWFCSNSHTAYNTFEANKLASDMATQSILNLLDTGEDKYKVN